jgi:hypothetical protein
LPKGSFENTGIEIKIHYGEEGPIIGKGKSKAISIEVTNHTREAWEGSFALKLPSGWIEIEEHPFTLASKMTLEWNVNVQANEVIAPSYQLTLCINRKHDNQFWNKERVQFSLVAASQWSLRAPGRNEAVEFALPGNAINFNKLLQTEQNGIYSAATIFVNPSKRNVRLIAATSAPVKVYLNGALLFEDENQSLFMSAFHRAVASKSAEFTLDAGRHKLEIEVVKETDEPLEVYILPVSTGETKTPGPFYYYVDCLLDSGTL